MAASPSDHTSPEPVTGEAELVPGLREQRIESVGVLAGGLAHNLNNLMAPILLACDTLDEWVEEGPGREALELIRSGAGRAAQLCTGLLAYARGAQGRRIPVDLSAAVRETIDLLAELLPRAVRLRTSFASSCRVFGDPAQLQQIVMNLCMNARDAMPAGGELEVSVEVVRGEEVPRDALGAEWDDDTELAARIRVADEGVGIDTSSRRELWDPFFTTKDPGKGTGLGLPSTLAIVESHGGLVSLSSAPGAGTTFDVYLPMLPDDVGAGPVDQVHSRPPEALHVLVIDDEPSLRRALCRSLERWGHHPTPAEGAEDGLALVGRDASIDVVVTDLLMPGTGGDTVVELVEQQRPDLPILVISGAPSDEVAELVGHRDQVIVLAKPFTTDELLSSLDRAMGARGR